MTMLDSTARPNAAPRRPHCRPLGGTARTAALLCLSLIPLLGTLPGCSVQQTFSNQRTPAAEAYAQGNYRDAYYNALVEQRVAGNRRVRDEAGLTAGLAAYAKATESVDPAECERWLDASTYALRPLADNSDRNIAGSALAALGLIEAMRARFPASADLLSRAATRLTGEESASASFHAGLSYELAGSTTAARQAYHAALAQTKDPDLRRSIESRLGRTRYTIQIGAYTSRQNAEQAGIEAGNRARAQGLDLPGPHIVAGPDASGRTLYRVNLGSFATRNEALAARLRFAPEATVTTAVTPN
jgi:predicted transcriptional regulator